MIYMNHILLIHKYIPSTRYKWLFYFFWSFVKAGYKDLYTYSRVYYEF